MYFYVRNVQDRQVGHTTVSLSCLYWNLEHLLEKIEAPLTLILSPGASIRENTVYSLLKCKEIVEYACCSDWND